MIREVLVPLPVSAGIGSVTVPATNSASGFKFASLNGKCIQIGLIPPVVGASGSFYTFDNLNFVPNSANFTGAYNWSGVAGYVGDITVNIVGASQNGLYLIVFLFEEDQKGR